MRQQRPADPQQHRQDELPHLVDGQQEFRDRPHRAAPVDTREHDAQPRGIAQQAEQVGKRNDALIGCDKRRRQDRSANI